MARKTKAPPPPAPRYVLNLGRSDYTGEVVTIVNRPRPGLVRVELVRLPGLHVTCGDDRITEVTP